VRSPATTLAAALGALIASAVVGLAPTARAGYLPVTVTTTVGPGLGADVEPTATPPPHVRPAPDPTAWSGAAGTVPPRPAPDGNGPPPPADLTTPAARSAPDLIVYVRSVADRFGPSDHPPSILDPPRRPTAFA
jgi:hypothetical protein